MVDMLYLAKRLRHEVTVMRELLLGFGRPDVLEHLKYRHAADIHDLWCKTQRLLTLYRGTEVMYD